jgi:hypothetical protein
MLRESTAVALASFLALGPSASLLAAPSVGTVSGQVTVEGRPLSGMGLAVVDLKSGEIHRTKSDAQGNYRLRVQAGEYVVTSLSLAGLGVGKAPSRVVVEAGRVVVASLDLLRLPVVYQTQEPVPAAQQPASGPQTSGNITHEPVGCLVAGQFPLIEATIEPAASVARARVYFKSALGSAYYFVEMTLQDGKFVGKLPKPKLEASPITYYVQATTTEFGESQTAEVQAQVVADESECPEGLKVAPIGPAGAVTVFSATTAAVAVPVGFAAGGLAIAGGTLALVGGLLGAGALAATQLGDTTTTTTSPTTTTVPPTTTTVSTTTTTVTTSTTTTTAVPGPACSYNVFGDPLNCPCAQGATVPATGLGPPLLAKPCP